MFSLASLRTRMETPLLDMTQGAWDLTVSLPEPRLGRLRALATAFNRVLSRLQGIVVKMASASVGLCQVAPQLADLSRKLHGGAQDQARRAREIALASRHLEDMVLRIAQGTEEAAAFSAQVAHTTHSLHEGSRDIGEIMALIGRVANQTKLLSLNAAVEAARAGRHGLGFAVVAGEIQRLADQTMNATNRVGEILGGISTRVEELVQAVGGQENSGQDNGGGARSGEEKASLHILIRRIAEAGQAQQAAVAQVSQDIQSVAGTAEDYLQDSEALNRLGQNVRESSESLLMTLGVFRLAAHRKASQVVQAITQHPELLSMQRARMEAFLRQVVERYRFFELVYVTDAQGRQVVDNVAPSGFSAVYGSGGHGQSWSNRPWFKGAMAQDEVYISDIYRSAATDSFCFTISNRLVDDQGGILGVLGADVHFEQLLNL
jgi:methyl-accepting chemotaxis protein